MYQAVDASMIRVSVFPLAATTPCPPPPVTGDADGENCSQWIAQVWADDAHADAIELASPVLASAVRKVLNGTAHRSGIRRTALSLTRYLLRMKYRATPFGLFAGPVPLQVGNAAHIHWGASHKGFARADAVWLHGIITALEQDPDVLRRLRVVADPTCTVRGDQIAVSHRPGLTGSATTTLRRTRAAEKVLALAQSFTAVSDIVDKLHADYPETPIQTIKAMVRDLVAHRVLLTDLHAPMTCGDALDHLVAHFDDTELSSGPVGPTVEKLRQIHQLLHRHDGARPSEQRTIRAQATIAMRGLTAFTTLTDIGGRSLAVSLRPDCDIVLPEAVPQEAQQALETIARITPHPNGPPAWVDYRIRFLERYSLGTVVPVRELIDPDTGLGFPAGYRGAVLKRPLPVTTPRDEHLLLLAQDAALTSRPEIVLTGDDLAALTVGKPLQVPAHIEYHFTVLAATTRDLEEGRFTLSTVALSLAAGITTGRFLTTLDQADFNPVAAVHASLPTLTADAVRSQVSGPPLKVSINNVSRAPLVASELLSVGEYNPDATLHLSDLGVVADSGRLCLVSLATGRLVEPSVMNAVELSNSTHPLIRFVCEVHRSHTAVLLPFDWGAASRLPYLPTVRIGRTVLSAARWRLHPRDLGGEGNDHWGSRFTDWRNRYGVPRTVYVGGSDQRLRLDLDVPAHQELLRTELKRHGTAVLQEAPEEDAFGWIGHAHEVTMPFASNQRRLPAPAFRTTVVSGRDPGRLPGASQWAYLKLYGSSARAPEVLTSHIPRLLRELGSPAAWWFTRYADPEAHLRLRLRLPGPDAFGTVAQRAASWAAELCEEGLIQHIQWDTDRPEAGRYGTGVAMEAAERFFAADSEAALAQMSLTVPNELQPAVTAASFVDIAAGFLGSEQSGYDWLTRHVPRADGQMAPRDVQAVAVRLSAAERQQSVLRGFDGGDRVARAWQLRHVTLGNYRQALEAASASPGAVLPSLIHMHHNRVAGIDRAAEATCRRLARSAALSWTVRTEGAPR